MEIRTIKTKLVGRNETFNQLAVAEATQLPILLRGVPGVGKTKALLDYAKAFHQHDFAKTIDETFILETDEGTRPAEIKGRIDMKKLVTSQEYSMISPIAHASFVLINEIDKAAAGLRNSLLGVMNERYLFNGSEKVPCDWNVFAASCNIIPDEEKENPFWDRFVLKHDLSRISKDMHMAMFNAQAQGQIIQEIDIHVPTPEEMEGVIFNSVKLGKFVDMTYNKLSDRTLSYVPRIAAAVKLVYGIDLNNALIKTADILMGFDTAQALANALESKAVINLRGQIDMLRSLPSMDKIKQHIEHIKTGLSACIKSGDIAENELESFLESIQRSVASNPVKRKADQQEAKPQPKLMPTPEAVDAELV